LNAPRMHYATENGEKLSAASQTVAESRWKAASDEIVVLLLLLSVCSDKHAIQLDKVVAVVDSLHRAVSNAVVWRRVRTLGARPPGT